MTDRGPFERDILDGEFAIRPAESTDIDAVLEIENRAQPAPWSRKVFEKEFSVEWSEIWVVEPRTDEDLPSIVAYLVFWVVHDEIHILNIVVHPVAQRRGIARAVLERLVDFAHDEQTSIITLEVRRGNDPARELYRNQGFRAIGERARYYSDNEEDAIVMARILDDHHEEH